MMLAELSFADEVADPPNNSNADELIEGVKGSHGCQIHHQKRLSLPWTSLHQGGVGDVLQRLYCRRVGDQTVAEPPRKVTRLRQRKVMRAAANNRGAPYLSRRRLRLTRPPLPRKGRA
jgi:hypothetical protein